MLQPDNRLDMRNANTGKQARKRETPYIDLYKHVSKAEHICSFNSQKCLNKGQSSSGAC